MGKIIQILILSQDQNRETLVVLTDEGKMYRKPLFGDKWEEIKGLERSQIG